MLGSDLSIVIQRHEQILCFGYKYFHDIPHDYYLHIIQDVNMVVIFTIVRNPRFCYHKYQMSVLERRRVASEPCWRLD